MIGIHRGKKNLSFALSVLVPYFYSVIRRTSILVLASVVSFLATQPLPSSVTSSGQGYAIHWQSEARAQKAAEMRALSLRVTPPGTLLECCGEPTGPPRRVADSNPSPRAPPLPSRIRSVITP